MNKYLLGALMAFSLFLFPRSISAAEVTYNFPQSKYNSNVNQTLYQGLFESLQANSDFQQFTEDVTVTFIPRGYDYDVIILQPEQQYYTDNLYTGYVFLGDYAILSQVSGSSLSSVHFTVTDFNPSYTGNVYGLFLNDSSNAFCLTSGNIIDSSKFNAGYWGGDYSAFYFISPPVYDPKYEEISLPFYSLDVDGFYDWIINNNKLVEFPLYITQAKLKSFLEFYKSFGSSNTFFVSKIADWFAHMNIANQSMSNISALKHATDKLYQEYINYRSGTHAYWPNATKIQERNDIDTKTDNNNVTLVTDDANDTLDISILRDILRGVIAISNNVNQGCANIVQKLDELNFIVNVVNDGGDNSPIDLSSLYIYDSDAFSNDLQNFEASIEDVQSVPQGYINTINQNSLMPENMLEDKNSLTVNIPTITGFTVNNNGGSYSTQTGSYVLSSVDYPWLDPIVQKIKRFSSIILILGYLVHLRYRIPELIRGE